jgi:hypothetical protein
MQKAIGGLKGNPEDLKQVRSMSISRVSLRLPANDDGSESPGAQRRYSSIDNTRDKPLSPTANQGSPPNDEEGVKEGASQTHQHVPFSEEGRKQPEPSGTEHHSNEESDKIDSSRAQQDSPSHDIADS